VSGYDVIVIGAGHNGLTAAGLLAKAGRRVVVVEQLDTVGGIAAAEEFFPGYRGAGLLHDTSAVRQDVIAELELEMRGVERRPLPPSVLALGQAGDRLLLEGDPARAAASIGERSAADAEQYLAYRETLGRLRPVLTRWLDEAPLDLVDPESNKLWDLARHAVGVRRLGGRQMLELLRLPPMCVADWLGEWFETDLLKAALALPAVAGSYAGPWSPGTNLNLLLHETVSAGAIVGGGPALVAALAAAVTGHGGEIRTAATVQGILVDSGSARGVRLESGEELKAPLVAASCAPKRTFLELLPPNTIAVRLEHRARQLRARGTTAQLLLALAGVPDLATHDDRPVEFARTGASLDDIERAFDSIKYRRFSEEPILEIHLPAAGDPSLAPEGHAVASILVHFAPRELEPEWNEEQAQRLTDIVESTLERHSPGLSGTIVGRRFRSPADLEERYGLVGGNIHHGEHSLDQLLVRPTPECLRYATPIEGLFLCGSGSHPGGGITCAPGMLAARAILG